MIFECLIFATLENVDENCLGALVASNCSISVNGGENCVVDLDTSKERMIREGEPSLDSFPMPLNVGVDCF